MLAKDVNVGGAKQIECCSWQDQNVTTSFASDRCHLYFRFRHPVDYNETCTFAFAALLTRPCCPQQRAQTLTPIPSDSLTPRFMISSVVAGACTCVYMSLEDLTDPAIAGDNLMLNDTALMPAPQDT